MNSVALIGSDTLIFNNRIISDVADNDVVTLTFDGDMASIKKGKNGNAIYTFNESGTIVSVVLRVLRGSNDDKYLSNILTQFKANRASFVLLTANFIKYIGDGNGGVTKETYIISGGIPTKGVDYKENTEGDSEQGVAVYNFKFANTNRSMR